MEALYYKKSGQKLFNETQLLLTRSVFGKLECFKKNFSNYKRCVALVSEIENK